MSTPSDLGGGPSGSPTLPPAPQLGADGAPRRGFLFRHPWIFFAAFGVIVLTLMRVAQGPARQLGDLPVLGVVPEFRLVDQTGQPFGTKELSGKPWIATFFFTSCQTQCPVIMAAAARVERDLVNAGAVAAGIPVVSISVDPEYDTPTVLAEYAAQRSLDGARWKLLTGPRADIEQVVVGHSRENPTTKSIDQIGFATAMGAREKTPKGIIDIAHSMKIVLVDARGGIRYYFDATDEKDLALVATHAVQLAKEAAK